jgi:hypothetical protein
MTTQLGAIGALSVWSALVGGVLLALGDAIGSGVLDALGAVGLIGGVSVYFVAAVKRSRREGGGLLAALARSAKEALRLAWYIFKSA